MDVGHKIRYLSHALAGTGLSLSSETHTMTTDQTLTGTDLNAEALEVLRTLVASANSLPEEWRTTILALVSEGIPGDLTPLEMLIASTRGNA